MTAVKKKIVQVFQDFPLSKKFVISYIIIILIPIAVFSYLVFNGLKGKYIEDTIKKNTYILGIEKTKVINNINVMEAISQKVLSSKRLIEYIQKKDYTQVADLIDLNLNTLVDIKNLQYSNPTIEDLKIYTNNKYVSEIGMVIFKESRLANISAYKSVIDYRGDEYWNLNFRVPKDESNVSTFYKRDNDYVSINKPICSYSNEYLGFLEVDMLSKNFFPTMYSSGVDGESQIVLLDNHGKLFFNKDNKLKEKLGISDEDIRKQFINNKKSSGSISLKKYDQAVIVYNYIPRINCYMINIVSMNSTFKNITYTRNIILLITFGLIILLTIVTKFINSLLLKKLHIMINTVESIERGNFDVTLDIRGKDELGQLAHQFRKLISKINKLIAEEVNKKESTREVELRALQTQIDSHFLYNTLENIKMIAEIEEQYLLSDSITALGEMMKYNMSWKSEYVNLYEEIEHIKNYVSLMNIRYDNKINLKLDINEELMRIEILKLILQPIVENSVKYAVKNNLNREFNVTIYGYECDNSVYVDIMDDGIGMDERQVIMLNDIMKGCNNSCDAELEKNKKGNGIGLKNVNERIKLFYGEQYGIKVFSELHKYTKIRICLPSMKILGG